jgi:phosphatidylinositol alpha-1,6-mannosyltransferase
VAIPLGVDHQRFSPEGRDLARRKFDVEGKLVLSSVARLHAYKGHDTVLEALAALPAAVRERFVYLVAGRGPHEQALRATALNRGISSRVRWLGFVSDDDLPDLYRASDLFLLCTHEAVERQEVEGFGLVFLEAQACGTPVVGARCGGIPEALREGEGAWLIEQGGVDGLVSLLLLLADKPEVFRAAGAAARARVERECTWIHYMDRFTSALKAEGIQIV